MQWYRPAYAVAAVWAKYNWPLTQAPHRGLMILVANFVTAKYLFQSLYPNANVLLDLEMRTLPQCRQSSS